MNNNDVKIALITNSLGHEHDNIIQFYPIKNGKN